MQIQARGRGAGAGRGDTRLRDAAIRRSNGRRHAPDVHTSLYLAREENTRRPANLLTASHTPGRLVYAISVLFGLLP